MAPRLGSVLLLLIVVVAACGGGSDKPAVTPTQSAPGGLTATATPVYRGSIKKDTWVRVIASSGCMDMLAASSLGAANPVNFCQPNGFEGYTVDGPVLSDGRWWWQLAGQGWAQDEHLQFVRSEDLSKRTVPELAGLGQIAYVGGDGGIWLMNADGSGRKRLVAKPPDATGTSEFIGLPRWGPDGQQLLYDVSTYDRGGTTFMVRIINLNGHTIMTVPDASSAFWSPDGARLGLLTGSLSWGEGVTKGTPSVFDIATGHLAAVGPQDFYLEGPNWRSNGHELMYVNTQGVSIVNDDGSNARLIIPAATPGQYYPTSWSPDGQRLAMQVQGDACRGYAVFSADRGSLEFCAPEPAFGPGRGGRGGSAEDGRTHWSPDGKFFGYHTEWATVNRSGVYVVDASSAAQTLLPGWAAAFTSFAPDSRHVVFSTYGSGHNEIWIGDAETGKVLLLAEGSQPAWRPVND